MESVYASKTIFYMGSMERDSSGSTGSLQHQLHVPHFSRYKDAKPSDLFDNTTRKTHIFRTYC